MRSMSDLESGEHHRDDDDSQVHCDSVVISSPHAGEFSGPDIDADLRAREPELMRHVVLSKTAFTWWR